MNDTTYTREFNQARKDQGFTSAEHLAAFFAYHDHMTSCEECKKPGEAYYLEGSASFQPTTRLCGIGVELFVKFARFEGR